MSMTAHDVIWQDLYVHRTTPHRAHAVYRCHTTPAAESELRAFAASVLIPFITDHAATRLGVPALVLLASCITTDATSGIIVDAVYCCDPIA